MPSKLNWLLNNTSSGSIILQSWLTRKGIQPSLAQKYTQSNWLIKLRSGVYVRPGREPEWQDAVFCLMNQLNASTHIAGLTSLQYQGKSHYLQVHKEVIWLCVQNKASIPKWFKAFPEKNNDEHQWKFITNNKLKTIQDSDIITLDVKGVPIKASTPELAAYEVLEAIPRLISFEHAAELFQGLVNLSPRKVESILKRSNSVRSNRLYLFFAHYYNHPWAKRLDESAINLGSGKRQIVQGGKLDNRYQITVPEHFISTTEQIG
jgi:hypothetical protein